MKILTLTFAALALGFMPTNSSAADDHKKSKDCLACCKAAEKCDACCHDKGKGKECEECCGKAKPK